MRVDVVTIFPDYLAPLTLSLVGKARARGLLDVRVHDLRDWTHDRHRTVDDTPYGGGAGMVMRPEPWGEALDERGCRDGAGAQPHAGRPDPGGRARSPRRWRPSWPREPWLVFACGRYEGIDHRVRRASATRMPVDEVSLGDYVLAGGEVAALVVVEAVTRLLPGVARQRRVARRGVATPARPAGGPGLHQAGVAGAGCDVPDVLLSGDHGAIARWRRDAGAAAHRGAPARPARSARPGHARPADIALLAELGST